MSDSIWMEAGKKLDRIAHELMDEKRINYDEAIKLAQKLNPNLAQEYAFGQQAETRLN